MSSKERLKSLYAGEKIDRVPFFTNATIYAGALGKLTSKEFYLNQELSYEIQRLTLDLHHCDGNPAFDFPGYTGLFFGGEVQFKDNPYLGIPVLKPFVKSLDDIDGLVVPNLKEDPNLKEKINFLKILDKNGVSIPITMGSPLEVAGNICDTGLLFKLFRKNPNQLHKLLRCATDYLKQLGDITIEMFGVEKCSCSANFPLDSLISPKLFEMYSLPYFCEVYDYFKGKGVKSYSLHLCGNHNENLDFFKEMNLPDRTFISLDEKVDIEIASSFFGENYILGGNVSTDTLINGSPNEVYNASRDIIVKNMFRKGGFVLMPSCTLPPYTPPLNLFAMYRACEDYGRY
jgi:uroporphyrinogen decarboxylase